MWLIWMIMCGTIFLIVDSHPQSQDLQNWARHNVPSANPERAGLHGHNFNTAIRRGSNSFNPARFFGMDRQQAEQLYRQYLKNRGQYNQKGKGQAGGNTFNPSNLLDLANIFKTQVDDSSKNTNYLPFMNDRFHDQNETDDPGDTHFKDPTARTESPPVKPPYGKNDELNIAADTDSSNTEDPSEELAGVTAREPIPPKKCEPSETVVRGERQCKHKLIFNELFQTLRRKFWNVDNIFAGAPDYDFVVYVDRPDTSVILNPNLFIGPARTEDIFGSQILANGLDLGPNCTGRSGPPDCTMKAEGGFIVPLWTSARLNTKNKFSFKYGNIEIRAKLPAGDWIYPILTLNPSVETYGKYYGSGQMRIAFIEGNDNYNKVLKGGVILGDSISARNYFMKNLTRDTSWAESFHKFQLQWKPDSITLGVDGEVYGKIEPPPDGFASLAPALNISNAEDWNRGAKLAPFDKEMYLQVGVGVGGLNFPDRVDGSKPWKNRERLMVKKFYDAQDQWLPSWDEGKSGLRIDYIKVWAL